MNDVDPVIWRRIVVPEALTLRELHDVLQIAMGWQNRHLHLFDVAGVRYGDVEDFDEPLGDADAFTVGQAAAAVDAFTYEYDFGDGWEHEVRVEQVIDTVGSSAPHVVAGARACPPEDCGGPGGYGHLIEVLANPGHRDFNDLVAWLESRYDPDALDLDDVNALLDVLDRLPQSND